MFGTIRKHQTWLWAVIITLTIISFVIFFSPYSKMHETRRGPGNYGSINGEKISPGEFEKAEREIYLRFLLMSGRWPDQEAKSRGTFDEMRDTYQWLLLLQKQRQMGITVSPEVLVQEAQQMVKSFEREGAGNPALFVKNVLQPRGFTWDDFERFVRHFVGMQELVSLVGVSGKLISPQEARALYEREHQEVSAVAVTFSLSNYLTNVTVTPEALTTFYSNQLSLYRIPDCVQVTYVKFPISNYLAGAEAELSKSNLNEMVEMYYQRLGTNYFRDAKTPEEAKAKVRQDLIKGRALSEAKRQAADFARPLLEAEAAKPEALEAEAKKKGLTVAVSAPFDKEDGPKDMEVGADFVKAAFTRNPTNDPFAGPILAPDGVYVIAYNKTLPSEIPPLDQIRDRVTADYRHAQAATLARQAGQQFAAAVTNGLAQGKSFTNICTEANVKMTALPPFSISTRALPAGIEDQVNLNQLKMLAFGTQPGKASSFQATGGGGAILYVAAKLPIDEAKLKADMPAYLSMLRRTRMDEAFNEWFRRESERGLRDTPLAKPPPPSMTGTARS